jgi:hypothetical protein
MNWRYLFLVCLFLVVPKQSHATLIIDVTAYIDESTVLVLKNDSIQWQHFDHAAVGWHAGLNEPTIITIKQDDNIIWDNYVWYPEWPEPVPAEIRYPAISSFLITPVDLNPYFPSYAEIEIIDSRYETTIVKQPTPHDEAVRIYFNDPLPGPVWYHSIITIDKGHWVAYQVSVESYPPGSYPSAAVPEPSLFALLAVGFLPAIVLLRRTRKRSRENSC